MPPTDSVPWRFAGGALGALDREVVGPVPVVQLDLEAFAPALLDEARRVWLHRATTEFRSAQVLTALLRDLLDAGAPVDLYASIADAICDEVRHLHLVRAVCLALGVQPAFPRPVALDVSMNARVPAAERAMGTALEMLVVNETVSVALIEDLRDRCTSPIRGVLDATLEDEDGHRELGWEIAALALRSFPPATRAQFERIVRQAIAPFEARIGSVLGALPESERHLGAHADAERVALGLFSEAREVLVTQRVIDGVVRPRLRALGLTA